MPQTSSAERLVRGNEASTPRSPLPPPTQPYRGHGDTGYLAWLDLLEFALGRVGIMETSASAPGFFFGLTMKDDTYSTCTVAIFGFPRRVRREGWEECICTDDREVGSLTLEGRKEGEIDTCMYIVLFLLDGLVHAVDFLQLICCFRTLFFCCITASGTVLVYTVVRVWGSLP